MTRRANARVAGSAFLLYIALGIPALILSGRATAGDGIAAKLVSIAQHATDMRVAILLGLFSSFMALVLGVSLYAITRDVDPDLAMLGMVFRVGEGVVGASSVQSSLGLLWLATASGPNAPRPESAQALAAFLLRSEGPSAILFAVGSTLFSWLLLRGRLIPAALAWLGVVSSVLWVVGFPLQLVHALPGVASLFLYLTMAIFEITLAGWLIFRGVPEPAQARG